MKSEEEQRRRKRRRKHLDLFARKEALQLRDDFDVSERGLYQTLVEGSQMQALGSLGEREYVSRPLMSVIGLHCGALLACSLSP